MNPELSDNVIDNENVLLKDKLADILPSCDGLSVAVGYFFISGFAEIAPLISNLKNVKILIGGATNAETAEALVGERVQNEIIEKRIDNLKQKSLKSGQEKDTLQSIRDNLETMPQKQKLAEGLDIFHKMMDEGRLKVRVFAGPFLHAKAYLLQHKEEVATGHGEGQVIVGSSNFSLSGLKFSNELNLHSRQGADYNAVNDWFDNRWGRSEEVTPSVLKLISGSWALQEQDPWEFYMQMLFWLNRGDLQGDLDPRVENNGPPLFTYQRESVVQAANRLEAYGGIFVADVVGLGKTYTGSALLSTIRHRWEDVGRPCNPLVIAPPRLVPMWEDFCSKFDINAAVMSSGLLSDEAIFKKYDFRQHQSYRNLILVDEAHNFRNDDTIKYKALERLCWNKPTILLTATPMNKGPKDIYNQLRLFLPDVGHQLNLEQPDLKEFFANLPELIVSEEDRKPLVDLLQQIMIRRTRRNILANYATEGPDGRKGLNIKGEWFYFPERKLREPLRYDIGKIYGKETLYDKIRQKLRSLTMASYGPGNYIYPKFKDKQPYSDLKQGSFLLIGLIRTLLLKRFESSVYAFRKTVGRMGIRCQTLIDLNKKNPKATYMPLGKEFAGILEYVSHNDQSVQDEREILQRLVEENIKHGKYRRDAFDVKSYIKDLNQDAETYREIHKMVSSIGPREDTKIKELQKLLNKLSKENKRILLFSEFADTINYLDENISYKGNKKAVSGAQDNAKEIQKAVTLFAPEPNHYELDSNEKEIDLLLTTDVISEGQNLQTGNVIINYDIHWNPVRLIQRIGRVDRIGSKHAGIDVYNFLPDPELEKNLGLEAVVRKHIDDIQYVIGEDSKILTRDERLNKNDLYAIYVNKDEDIFEEQGEDTPLSLDRMEILKEWLEEEKTRENKLIEKQKGMRTAKDGNGAKMAIVALEAGAMKSFYKVKKDKNPEKIRQNEALALMESKKNEKVRELPDDMDEIIETTRTHFWNDYWEYQSKLHKIRGNTREQKWVKKSLSHGLKFDFQILDRIRKQFNQGLPLTLLRELRRMQKKKVSGEKLVIRLRELAKEYNLEPEPVVFQPHKARVLGAVYLW